MNPIFTTLLGIIPDVISRVIPNDSPAELQKKLELQAELTKAIMASQDEQNKVNAVEASHASLFVAGWRPFIGWVCGVGLALTALSPIINLVTIKAGLGSLPTIDADALNTILMGMLGLGGLRTAEKINYVRDSAIKLKK